MPADANTPRVLRTTLTLGAIAGGREHRCAPEATLLNYLQFKGPLGWSGWLSKAVEFSLAGRRFRLRA